MEKLLESKKYRSVCPDTIRRIWAECQGKYKRPRDVDRAAREALHGITGAFLTTGEVSDCHKAIEAWAAGGRRDEQLAAILTHHASTRERLPLSEMDELYRRLFQVTGAPGTLLDLACGINPIYLGARGYAVTGVDISGAAVSLVNAFGELSGAPVRALCADLLCPGGIPDEPCDVALLFKALPLIQRQRREGASALLGAINARHIVISFPTRTLSGRDVGMAGHYAKWMDANLGKEMRVVDQFEQGREMFYVVRGASQS